MTWMISEDAKSLKGQTLETKRLRHEQIAKDSECHWMMSGWKEKELSFKPIDIAKDTPFSISSTGAEKKSG